MKISEGFGFKILEGEDNVNHNDLNENTVKVEAELLLLNQAVDTVKETSVQGAGLILFVDADGILNVTYDDGEEGTENETDNPSS